MQIQEYALTMHLEHSWTHSKCVEDASGTRLRRIEMRLGRIWNILEFANENIDQF